MKFQRAAAMFAAFLAGVMLALLGGVLLRPARAMRAEPTIQITSTFTPRPTSTQRPTRTATVIPSPTVTAPPAVVTGAGGIQFGWPGEVQCHNCSPFQAHIRLHHYNPNDGDINCFEWSDEFQYCMSPTSSFVPWESVWGIAAACPMEWPIGTWVDIPDVGMFICLDRGDLIYCQPDMSLCEVDLLGPGGAEWDGKEFDVTLWVPLKPRK